MVKLLDYLSESVDLQGLIDGLDFGEEELPAAALAQPKLFLEVARYRIRAIRNKLQAESAYDAIRTEVSLKLRRRYRKEDGKRTGVTEAFFKDKVGINSKVRRAKEKFEGAVAVDEWTRLLVEAYRMRRDTCRILAEVLGAEISAQERLARASLSNKGLDKMREKIRKKFKGAVEQDQEDE